MGDPLAADERWLPEPTTLAQVTGPQRLDPFEREIDIHKYKADFPPHPTSLDNAVGTSAWSDVNTNR